MPFEITETIREQIESQRNEKHRIFHAVIDGFEEYSTDEQFSTLRAWSDLASEILGTSSGVYKVNDADATLHLF